MIFLVCLYAFLWPFVAYAFLRRKENHQRAVRERLDAVIRGY